MPMPPMSTVTPGLTPFAAPYATFIRSTNCSGEDSRQNTLYPGRCGSFQISIRSNPG